MMLQHETRPRKASISQEAFWHLCPGDIITYLLPLSELPTDPHHEWHGRVERVAQAKVTVTSLDEGYLDEVEEVWRSEIVAVRHIS